MAELEALKKTAAPKPLPRLSGAEEAALAAEQERALGRKVAYALPLVTVLAAITAGLVTSVGPAILVLASGALLATIVLLWASLRTLGGDAPLPSSFEDLGMASRHDELTERKERVLRALKDLENERDVGKLDAEDYVEVSSHYRDEAKEILRELDSEVAPLRARAEQIAATYLKKRGLAPTDTGNAEAEATPDDEGDAGDSSDAALADKAAATEEKTTCPSCATANDVDATFCKKCATRLVPEEPKEPADATR